MSSRRKTRCNAKWVPRTHWLYRGNPATGYEAILSREDGEWPARRPRRGFVSYIAQE
jgi:hypothetical protein